MIAAVITETSVELCRQELDRLTSVESPIPLMAEVRCDKLLGDWKPGSWLEACYPVIASCRRREDGGAWSRSEAERLACLRKLCAREELWVDVEMDALPKIGDSRARVLASLHDFDGIPHDLEDQVQAAFAFGASAVKVAVTPKGLSDLVRLHRLARGGKVVAIGLGDVGLPTRWLFARMGCPWTYASLQKEEIAPGVPSLQAMLAWAPLLERGALFGVLSDRARESMGPEVWNRAFLETGISGLYLPVTTPDLKGLHGFAECFGFRAFSVTTPFKEEIASLADARSPEAEAVSAGNSFWRDEERWHLHNTDIAGVAEPLRGVWPGSCEGAALVIGVGGAGRAAAFALRGLGFEVAMVSRHLEKARAIARDLGVGSSWPKRPPRLVVNATPVGGPRDPEGLPLPANLVAEGQWILEMNYHLGTTPLESLGLERGAQLISGAAMYLAQARGQLECFGLDAARLAPALERAIARRIS